VLTLVGCGDKKPTIEVEKKELPAWIMHQPTSDSSTLYGVGEGQDKQTAITNALNEMLSTLSISVASEYNSNTNVSNYNGMESYVKNIEEKVNTKVKELRISNYQIMQYEKIGFNKYAVLLKSDKNAIFNSLRDEIDKKLALLHAQENTYKSTNDLKQLAFYKQASFDLDDLIYKSIIMKALDTSYDDSYIIKEVAYFRNTSTALQSKISFTVYSDAESENLIPVIKDALTAKGLKVANQRNEYHLDVVISSQIVKAESSGFTLARSAIDIDLKDANNHIISTKKLNITGQSTQGYKVAEQNIAYKLNQLISKDGTKVIMDGDF
jgi:hypothetical protein